MESEGDFVWVMRMEPEMFREILMRVSERIRKQTTKFRKPLEPGLKLAITLRHLATGESYHSLAFAFRVPHNTISLLIREVCQQITEEFQDVIATPKTPFEWKQIAQGFSSKWQFNHCLGTLDGKHVAITCPQNSGSVFHNYKGYFSIVLLALVDANYKFIWADIGGNKSTSDCALFNRSKLRRAIEIGTINFPEDEAIEEGGGDVPYFIVGDDAFPLRTWLMKPFSKRNMTAEERIFNYRLSRARRVVENAFGILANRFQCLVGTMRQEHTTVTALVTTVMCLHNVMRMRYPGLQNAALDQEDSEHHLIPGFWRQERTLDDMTTVLQGNQEAKKAREQRIYLKNYCCSSGGRVPWQEDILHT